jgi:Domain of unknown function (DUF4410)
MKMHCSPNTVTAQDHRTLTFPCNSPEHPPALISNMVILISCLFALVLAAGCASTEVTGQEQLVTGQLPRPANIWVYDFAATADDLPAESVLAGQPDLDTTPQTAEQIAEGRKLGDQIASELVGQIRDMGLPAVQASAGTKPQINDLVIRGYLLSIQEGSAAKRVAIGFGSGASELKTAVEGFQMTAQGLRKLGTGTVEAGGSKSPGAALGLVGLIATANPAGLIVSSGVKVYGEESGSSKVEGRAKATAKEIADALKKRFQQEGWIDSN